MVSPERFKAINSATIDRHDMFYWQVDRPTTNEEFVDIFMARHDNVGKHEIVSEAERLLAPAHVTSVGDGKAYRSGSVNVNRLLTLDDGQHVVARVHPVGLANGYFDVEACAMQAAATAHVPVPEVIGVSHRVMQGGLDMMLMSEMPGQNMKHYLAEHPEKEASLVADLGRKMAQLHQVRVQGYGFFDNQLARDAGELRGLHQNFRSHLLAALPANLKVLTEAGYMGNDQADRIVNLLHESSLTDCADPRLLHNDMADWNVLTDGKHITAVLDWDECFAGDPAADIACWSLFFAPERLNYFLQGYEQITPLGDEFEAKLHIYRLRYVVSKLSLRHRKLGLQNDDIMKHLVKVGLEALAAESAYFGI